MCVNPCNKAPNFHLPDLLFSWLKKKDSTSLGISEKKKKKKKKHTHTPTHKKHTTHYRFNFGDFIKDIKNFEVSDPQVTLKPTSVEVMCVILLSSNLRIIVFNRGQKKKKGEKKRGSDTRKFVKLQKKKKKKMKTMKKKNDIGGKSVWINGWKLLVSNLRSFNSSIIMAKVNGKLCYDV